MTFDDLPAGERTFVDANTLVYHFAAHPQLRGPCTHFIERISRNEIAGFTSTSVLSETAHRLMVYEASRAFGWVSKVVDRLKRQPKHIQQLSDFRNAIDEIPRMGIQILTGTSAFGRNGRRAQRAVRASQQRCVDRGRNAAIRSGQHRQQ